VLKNDELSELKGQFLASLNHEIRTPLSGILGMSDLLLETPLSEEQKEYVDATRLCAENLLEILNATLEYSALSANHIHLEEEEYPLLETLEGVVAQFAFKAKAKGLELRHSFDRNLPEAVVGDALRVRQLVWHLVANAVKFTNKGEVEIRASASLSDCGHSEVSIQVSDTGIGIPASHLSTIFESFRQLETGLSRNYPGLGLGLAVAQKLAILLDGELAVQSEPGKGSTFSLRLPVRLPVETQLRPMLQRVRAHLLVVDDDSVAQTIASHVLRRHDYDVECVCNGPAAIDKVSRTTFDLILMDLQMPGMDGFQTAKYIRAIPEYAETPIIAVTANCSSDYRDRCMQTGMQGFLAKPVQSRELVKAVERHLAGRTPSPHAA
jgi:CheY-like chemotaxis protein